MEYPREFSIQAQARVEAAKIRAGKAFSHAKKNLPAYLHGSRSEVRDLLKTCIMTMFAAFADGACDLGRQGVWTVARIDDEAHEFLRKATRDAFFDWGYDTCNRGLSAPISNSGHLAADFQRELKSFAEWRQYEEERLKVAEFQSTGAPKSAAQMTETPKRSRSLRQPKPELLTDRSITVNRTRAAMALGITTRTLDRWIKGGNLTAVALGSRKRFRTKDLQRILNQRNADKRDIK
jgi:excisionase family DNA binding protein